MSSLRRGPPGRSAGRRDPRRPVPPDILISPLRPTSMPMFGLLTIALVISSAPLDEPNPPPASTQRIDFDAHIKPIFQARCLNCHAKGKYKGGLSLETREAMLKGGEDGPAVVPGK